MLSNRRKALLIAAAGTVTALSLLPLTGWMVRRQVGMALGGASPSISMNNPPADATDIAARHPEDISLQIAAAAQRGPKNAAIMAALDGLRPRYGDSPALQATILRYYTEGPVMVRRPEEATLTAKKSDKPMVMTPSTDTEALTDFDDAAAAGERLEPDNAYFPAMRAIELFATHQDDAALEAVARASALPRWDEHIDADVQGRMKIAEARYGEPGGVARAAIAAGIIFPQYASLRGVARMSVYHAVEAEKAGNTEEGFRIRHNVARLGALMRLDSTSVIGSLVGIAIEGTAGSRPGGAEPLEATIKGEDRGKVGTERYIAYLKSIGHDDEANWVSKESDASTTLRTITRTAMDQTVFGGKSLLGLLAAWCASFGLLVNALSIIAFGAGAALLTRLSPRLRAGERLSKPGAWGIVAGLGCCILTAFPQSSMVVPVLTGLVAISILGIAVAARFKARAFGLGIVSALITFAVLGIVALYTSQTLLGPQGYVSGVQSFAGALNGNDTNNAPPPAAIMLLAMLSVTLMPVLMMGGLAILSAIVRIPVSVGVTRGMRGLALPVACAVLLGYGVAAVYTARQESRFQADLREMEKNEGPYLARLVGQAWPGRVTE